MNTSLENDYFLGPAWPVDLVLMADATRDGRSTGVSTPDWPDSIYRPEMDRHNLSSVAGRAKSTKRIHIAYRREYFVVRNKRPAVATALTECGRPERLTKPRTWVVLRTYSIQSAAPPTCVYAGCSHGRWPQAGGDHACATCHGRLFRFYRIRQMSKSNNAIDRWR